MNVVILHRYFWPDPVSAMGLIYGDIAEHHLDVGDSVAVYAGAPDEFMPAIERRYADALAYSHFRSAPDRKLPPLARIRNGLRLLWMARRPLFSRGAVDLVYVATYPPLLAWCVLGIGRVVDRRRNHLFFVQDNVGYRIRNRYLRSLFNRLLRQSIRWAATTITISETMRQELLGGFSHGDQEEISKKLVTLRNYSVDSPAPQEASCHPTTDIIYAGNHGVAQNLDLLIEAIALMKPQPSVAFYGEGTEKQNLKILARRLGAQVEFFDAVSREQAAIAIQGARLGLVGAMPDLLKYAFPSKLATYNALGVPAIVMAEPTNPEVDWIRVNRLGFPGDPVNAHKLADDIAKALSHAECTADGLAERSASLYSKDRYFEAFFALGVFG